MKIIYLAVLGLMFTSSILVQAAQIVEFAKNNYPCASGNNVWLTNQVFSTHVVMHDKGQNRIEQYWTETYTTDLFNEGGLIIWMSNPNFKVKAYEVQDNGLLQELVLYTAELEEGYRVIYTDRSVLGKVVITVTDQRKRPYTIGFIRYEYDPV